MKNFIVNIITHMIDELMMMLENSIFQIFKTHCDWISINCDRNCVPLHTLPFKFSSSSSFLLALVFFFFFNSIKIRVLIFDSIVSHLISFSQCLHGQISIGFNEHEKAIIGLRSSKWNQRDFHTNWCFFFSLFSICGVLGNFLISSGPFWIGLHF